ncbi:hypothetical protein LK09_01785 [Microbacterium mangrovi]|uniref:Methylamine utilisation protein MauE domain-containing protein n=1 Tax=Microbacterium mangrovi TaxID=1348253 RepID=A0A0B2A7E0_9MICO|nr:MauE/DoxX family redox-associated membrane protein [Microbacterium mangrovi]KHK99419.1 hypothetical protein LK09_01785 [Microbacterium mangrovi]
MEVILIAARMLGGGYFVWAGSAKMSKSRQFWSEIMGYKIVGSGTSAVLASVLPPVEFICGLMFAAGVAPTLTGIALLLLLLVFSGAIVVCLVRRTGNDCGCGSTGTKVTPMLLVRNAILAGLIVAGTFSTSPTYPGEFIVLAAGAIVAAIIAVALHQQVSE